MEKKMKPEMETGIFMGQIRGKLSLIMENPMESKPEMKWTWELCGPYMNNYQ